MIRCLILLLFCGALQAQAIDRQASRFLTDAQGRPGTYAPFRVQFNAPAGSTADVAVQWRNVTLVRRVAVSSQPAHADVPMPIAAGASVRVQVGGESDAFEPVLPPRSVTASLTQRYVAVFAPDEVYARAILPPEPGVFAADYYSTDSFFADWRMLDGYDAVVLLNPDDARLPPAAQLTIAEFCSLGGAVFVAGSFRFGQQAANMPAPGEPESLVMAGTQLHRFEYGAGAIYRCGLDALRAARSSRAVVLASLHDHAWFGATQPPGGSAQSRALAEQQPLLERGEPSRGTPGPIFWLLSAALLAACGVVPVLAGRTSPRAWVPGAATGLAALLVAISSLAQSGPAPVADCWSVVSAGARTEGPKSARTFVLAEAAAGEWHLALDQPGPRLLPRPWAISAWVVDQPLVSEVTTSAPLRAAGGRVGAGSFRDWRQADHDLDVQQGRLLDWWLENNAWRGRAAEVAAATGGAVVAPPEAEARPRGSILVQVQRAR